MRTISTDNFELCLTDLYEKETTNAEQTLDEVPSACVLGLKGKLIKYNPKDTGEYARGWRVRTTTVSHEKVRIIYSALRSDLTPMLEYGTHNRSNSVQMEARQHICMALDEEIDQIMDELLARL